MANIVQTTSLWNIPTTTKLESHLTEDLLLFPGETAARVSHQLPPQYTLTDHEKLQMVALKFEMFRKLSKAWPEQNT